MFNTAEIFALTDRTRIVPRCTEASLACLDVLAVLLNVILPAANLLSVTDLSWECGEIPQEQCEEEERFQSEALCTVLVLPAVVA